MIKKCLSCKQEFECIGNKKFCSDICKHIFNRKDKLTMKERWAIPEYKDKMKKKFKEVG